MAKARQREEALASVFAALDARDEAEQRVGTALEAMRELGESNSSLAELTGLTVREVAALLRLTDTDDEDTGGGDEDQDSDSHDGRDGGGDATAADGSDHRHD